ncbi:MAG: 50S ribosomal protein L9 [Acidimicrobiales bacterium]|nr:50S ribosomal protein L9 [Hyphomonadaceae bacterium]RZV37130.1 MAG: 50S ribosomal protein L9 [Acidimicrobiales bacterium]
MKIVLLEKVEKLGAIGDVVNVKDGFARNFLLPQSKALRATKANLVRFEAEREFIEARNAETAAKAQVSGGELDGKTFTVIRQAGETGILYGSVSSRDIAELVGGEVKRSMVALEQPIKNLGLHDVRVKLHPEVSINVVVNVARTEEEAVRQLAGEDVIKTQMDDDRATAEEQNAERADASEMFEGDYENQLDGLEVASDEASDETTGETKAKSDTEEE